MYKAVGLKWQPVLEKGAYSDSNSIVQPLQMAMHISLKTVSGLILTHFQPKFASKNEKQDLKVM